MLKMNLILTFLFLLMMSFFYSLNNYNLLMNLMILEMIILMILMMMIYMNFLIIYLLYYLTVMVCESVLGLSLLVIYIRMNSNDLIKLFNLKMW